MPQQKEPNITTIPSTELKQHAIICGYGRVGQRVVTLLEQENVPYIALDLDSARVFNAKQDGKHVAYGDASQIELLRAAGLEHAKTLTICLNKPDTVIKILQQVQRINPHLTVLVRSHEGIEIERYHQLGANEIIPEILESSLILGAHLLIHMGIPAAKVYQDMEDTRHSRYHLFKRLFPAGHHTETNSDLKQIAHITVGEHANALGKHVNELDMHGVNIISLRRHGVSIPLDDESLCLQTNDILVIYATDEQNKVLYKLLN